MVGLVEHHHLEPIFLPLAVEVPVLELTPLPQEEQAA
jgi:hypothetical protein